MSAHKYCAGSSRTCRGHRGMNLDRFSEGSGEKLVDGREENLYTMSSTPEFISLSFIRQQSPRIDQIFTGLLAAVTRLNESGSGQHGVLPKIPVFVFPPILDFFLDDHKSHKRVLTIYNPYDFDVKFKVLCTCPEKYKVIESEGSIRSQCQIDLVVRHLALSSANCNVTDKFRIRVLHYDTKQVLGQRDVPATLHMGLPDKEDDDRGSSSGSSKSVERHQSGDWKSSKHFHSQQEFKDSRAVNKGSISPVILLCGLVCIVALLLPNEGEVSSIPLSIPTNMKLVFSYVLGLVTMVIFRS